VQPGPGLHHHDRRQHGSAGVRRRRQRPDHHPDVPRGRQRQRQSHGAADAADDVRLRLFPLHVPAGAAGEPGGDHQPGLRPGDRRAGREHGDGERPGGAGLRPGLLVLGRLQQPDGGGQDRPRPADGQHDPDRAEYLSVGGSLRGAGGPAAPPAPRRGGGLRSIGSRAGSARPRSSRGRGRRP
jgi:hypothetical protein